jgi:hypothetical protein
MTRSRGTRRRTHGNTHGASRRLLNDPQVNLTGESDRSKAYDDPNRRTYQYRYRINGPPATQTKTLTYNDLPHDSVLRR